MTTPQPPAEYRAALAELFAQLAFEGFGTADGATFTALPGCEDAAAERLEQLLDLTLGGER